MANPFGSQVFFFSNCLESFYLISKPHDQGEQVPLNYWFLSIYDWVHTF